MQLHPKPNNSTSGPSFLFSKTIKTLSQKIDDSVGSINTFYSPMSIALALAMLYEGTDLKLRSDFEQVLGFSPEICARQQSMAFLDSLLSSAGPDPKGRKGGFQLTVGNSLWNADHCQLQPAFVSSLETMFKAHCEQLDMTDKNGSCDKVNGWISTKTAGLIKDMLKPNSFRPDLLLI
jgi:serpin B